MKNHLIKNLILSPGISTASVKRYLQLADQNPLTDRKVAIPAAIGTPSVASCQPSRSTSQQATSSVAIEDSVEQRSLNDNAQPASTIPPQEFTEEQPKCTISPPCKKSTTDHLASEPPPFHQNTFNTTLYVASEEFLDQHITQGIDKDDLRRRICPGVKKTDLGCYRVQNHIIFQILDKISGKKLP